MSIISFDISFKKKTDVDSFRLLSDSEYHQLKLMISGKYRIYDTSTIFIYQKNNLLTASDKTKLRDIFPNQKKVKLEVSQKPLQNQSQVFKHFCKCKNGALYVCDKCDEFLCESCKKKKHNTHINRVIKIKDYAPYIKTLLKNSANELDEKIINDDAYQFFNFWSYDLSNEISNINQCYEFIKKEIEDIKQIQIDYIISLCDYNRFSGLKSQIDTVIRNFASFDINDEFNKIIVEKNKILDLSNAVLAKYNEMKYTLMNYTNIVKDMQMFNVTIMKEIKEKFNFIKKKYFNAPSAPNPALGSSASMNMSFANANPNDTFYSKRPIHNKTNSSLMNSTMNQGVSNDKLIFKLITNNKVVVFSAHSQTFKEKAFIDNNNFKAHVPNLADTTQLNLPGKLYILCGKKYNKVFFYDHLSNTMNYHSGSNYSHYYGCLIHCEKNESLYLIGGNNQPKCEMFELNPTSGGSNTTTVAKWKPISSLNDERQEFASMCMNDYIYVFFGFSPKKGINLSSIERLNVNTNDKFEVIYVNEQITLSSLACARYIDDEEEAPNEEEILLLGGFDGKNYVDTSLVFNSKEMKIRDCDIIIPNMSKHNQFLFHKECVFKDIDATSQMIFDMKNNVHLITKESYELFTEAP